MSNFPTLSISATQTINVSRPLINTYLSDAKTAADNHISGSADKHDAAHITYSGNITAGSSVEGALDTTADHFNGSLYQHAAQHITYAGDVVGATHVKSALDTLDARIDTIVGYSGTSTVEVVDARESAVKGKTFTVLDDRLEAIEGEGPGYTYEGKNFTVNNPYRYSGSLTLKGQLHCHTTNSDGTSSPAVLMAAYRDAGYDFITITDHDYITSNPAITGAITWLGSGIEEGTIWHMTAYDISAQYTAGNTQDAFNFYRESNKMTGLAHSVFRSEYILDKSHITGLYGFNFIEVYNALVLGNCEEQWDYALSAGKKVFGTGVDDCHWITASASFNAAWVMVNATANESALLLESLRKGNFYASTGNDITISVSGKIITAESPGSSVISFIGMDGRVLQSSTGTSVTYTIKGDEVYVRVKSVLVSNSTTAWSQPIFLDVNDNDKTFSDISRTAYIDFFGRQAITNGNFNLWQRGTTATNPTDYVFLADGLASRRFAGAGTAPSNIVISRQAVAIEDFFHNSSYCLRYNADGAGVLGVDSLYGLTQDIEHGTRLLCGDSEKVTISFWARSEVAGRKIAVGLRQQYGSGGSPSASEILQGETFDLTIYWVKYTHTFTTNTLAAKTFGTSNNDVLRVYIATSCGSDYDAYVACGTGFDFVGSGYTDIARIQLCSGTEELPFMPQSFSSELVYCQRYYEKSYNQTSVPGSIDTTAPTQIYIGGTKLNTIPFKITKAIATAAITLYSTDGTAGVIRNVSTTANVTATVSVNENGFTVNITAAQTLGDVLSFHWTAEAIV